MLDGKSGVADLLDGLWGASGFDELSENGFWLLKLLYETSDFFSRLGETSQSTSCIANLLDGASCRVVLLERTSCIADLLDWDVL